MKRADTQVYLFNMLRNNWQGLDIVNVKTENKDNMSSPVLSMMTPSNQNISRVTGLCEGNPTVTNGFP